MLFVPQNSSALLREDFPFIESLESRIAPAVFLVATTADSTDAAHDTGSLRDAIALANAQIGKDTIKFHLPAPPPHSENIITLTGGELLSAGEVAIQGPGAGKLIINGNGSRVFHIDDLSYPTSSPAIISGLSIVNGSGDYGGGIYSTESLTLKHVVISGNSATKSGGGLNVVGNLVAGTKVSISNSLIAGNNATGFGGGMSLAGLAGVTINKTKVTGNSVANKNAGGIYAELLTGNTHLRITGSTISDNTAVYDGGGLYAVGFGALTISKSSITDNKTTKTAASQQGGGGVFIKGNGTATPQSVKIIGSQITGNSSARDGGGLYARGGLALTISGSVFSGNRATNGGGVITNGNTANKVDLTVTGSTFSHNIASAGGGGIDAFGDGAISIIASRVTGNIGNGGGGIYARSSDSLTLKNLTITDNFAETNGGGLSIAGTPDFHVSGGVFKGNTADDGGGIFIQNSTGSIQGDSISGNVALVEGGGVFQQATGTVTLQIATVIANTAPVGPNIFGAFTLV